MRLLIIFSTLDGLSINKPNPYWTVRWLGEQCEGFKPGTFGKVYLMPDRDGNPEENCMNFAEGKHFYCRPGKQSADWTEYRKDCLCGKVTIPRAEKGVLCHRFEHDGQIWYKSYTVCKFKFG